MCGCSQGALPMTGGMVAGKAKLETETKDSLYKKAQKYKIKGRSKMNKQELANAIRAKHAEIGAAIRKRGKK